jgi:hypothetical protein
VISGRAQRLLATRCSQVHVTCLFFLRCRCTHACMYCLPTRVFRLTLLVWTGERRMSCPRPRPHKPHVTRTRRNTTLGETATTVPSLTISATVTWQHQRNEKHAVVAVVVVAVVTADPQQRDCPRYIRSGVRAAGQMGTRGMLALQAPCLRLRTPPGPIESHASRSRMDLMTTFEQWPAALVVEARWKQSYRPQARPRRRGKGRARTRWL